MEGNWTRSTTAVQFRKMSSDSSKHIIYTVAYKNSITMVMMILSQIAIVQGNKVGIKATEAGFYRMSDPVRFERQDIEKYWSLRSKVSVAASYSNGLFGVYNVEAAVSSFKAAGRAIHWSG